MKLIVISPEKGTAELKVLQSLFDEGLEYFHLRKPEMKEKELREYLQSIPQAYFNKIILHSHHQLAAELSLKGIHYPEHKRNETRFFPSHLHLSTSFHSLHDLSVAEARFDYVFLSPIFNSISKEGYQSAFELQEIKEILEKVEQHVVALGGIDETNVGKAKEIGFDGVALLGAIWESSDPLETFRRIKQFIAKM
jgi:thiamine-phosphate pyrophosphorylase